MAFTTDADEVATDVLSGDGGLGATKFDGWLGPAEHQPAAETPAVLRLFTSPTFLEWLEIPKDEILARIPGAQLDEGRSVVWVRREARIRRCQSGCAYWFADAQEKVRDDPTARWPPP